MKIKTMFASGLAASMLCACAWAQTVSFDGTVTSARTVELYAASDAIVERIPVTVGQHVLADDVVAKMRTDKVYAQVDGVVTAVFGQAGDLTDTIAERYGAVMYIEDAQTYVVTASAQYAYDSVEAKTVHVGETVFLRSRTEQTRTGEGVITFIDGTAYTVHVTSGDFIVGESVNLYRDEGYADESRLGRGDIERNSPITVTGSGRIISLHAQPGDTVERGNLLMETLAGSGQSCELLAGVDGVVASIQVSQGDAASENEVLAVIWPDDAMQIALEVGEADLPLFAVGDEVDVAFERDAGSIDMKGTVSFISAVPSETGENALYAIHILFSPEDSVRYGMHATVTVTR